MLPPPINFPKWVEENQHLLQPPVNNYCVYQGNDFILMILGGPNARTDYHINETEEWFYQIKGDMLLKVIDEDNQFRDIIIKQGDMYLLPGNIPHNPVRFPDTIGLVMERVRPTNSLDTLRWCCSECQQILYQESFHCTNLGTQLTPIIERFANSLHLRKCKQCGTINSVK